MEFVEHFGLKGGFSMSYWMWGFLNWSEQEFLSWPGILPSRWPTFIEWFWETFSNTIRFCIKCAKSLFLGYFAPSWPRPPIFFLCSRQSSHSNNNSKCIRKWTDHIWLARFGYDEEKKAKMVQSCKPRTARQPAALHRRGNYVAHAPPSDGHRVW